jgi:prepilin-type N-terminal cleavage/methylation domain-containing protein
MRRLNPRGFTLIELMIVVVIIGILAAIAIPKFAGVSKNAKKSEAFPVLKQICTLQATYLQEKDVYAADESALTGFDAPTAKYYDFTSTGTAATDATAVASPNAAGTAADLPTITRDCLTGIDTES